MLASGQPFDIVQQVAMLADDHAIGRRKRPANRENGTNCQSWNRQLQRRPLLYLGPKRRKPRRFRPRSESSIRSFR